MMQREYGHLSRPVQAISPIQRIKILSLGEPKVGKSCLIKRYCEGRFVADYISTIGIDYGVKTADISGTELKINFWDVAGDPIYYEIRNEFYKDTHGVILVFDTNSRKSFDILDKWYDELKSLCQTEVAVALVANKTDLGNRVVTTEEGQAYATAKGFMYFETSASDGDGVKAMFDGLFSKSMHVTIKSNSKKKTAVAAST